jgi:LysM repeat protein
VKKGDTLSGIASRHGTSVSAIKSANRISGTLIRDGQKLVIPKR